MVIFKKVTQVIEIETTLVCDACKKEVSLNPVTLDILEAQEFLRIDRVGGYSSIFGDGSELKVDLCDRCLKKALTFILGNLDPFISNLEEEF